MSELVELLVGTKKGAFILESDATRRDWRVRGPFCETWPIHHLVRSGSDGALYAAGGNAWYGPSVWRSEDNGTTWSQSSSGLTYGDEGPKITTIWNLTPSNRTLYAGVEPAGLFRSDDRGQTWSHVAGLRGHPSTPEWQPGNGGLCLHSIVPHPTDDDRMWVGISAVGAFETTDGGRTWETRNRGVRADFVPGDPPEFGQCVHKMGLHPDNPDVLYQQNHCGVYRSDDGGRQWTEITPGLPSQFGFPMAIHPHDPSTVYVIPLNGDDKGRHMIEGHTAVWRSRDRGESWHSLDNGLPKSDAYLGVLREAMATDPLQPAGIYFGTSTGQIFGSADEGESWQLIADFLPPVWSVETSVAGS
ncbi:MAG: WD40/YVTN/BNR-like repeat-containing protein [Candidatus Limnocylindrales bacterium]